MQIRMVVMSKRKTAKDDSASDSFRVHSLIVPQIVSSVKAQDDATRAVSVDGVCGCVLPAR